MNKGKDKHHPPEEAPKNAKAADMPAPADQKTPAAVEPAEAEKLKKAEQEIDQHKDQLLRLRADFDNFRKRALREKNEIYETANEALMLELLPVIDHLQLAVKSAREHKADEAFLKGLELIADQQMDVLARYGLEPFSSLKQPFDPNLHEAVSCLPSETEPEGVIIAESRQGYRFKNKILRPAQVVVSAGRPAPAATAAEDQLKEE